MRFKSVCFGMLALFLMSGCAKVNEQRTLTVAPGEIKAPVIVDGPARDQNLTVTVNCAAAPVDVYIALESEAVDKGEARIPKSSLKSQMAVQGEATLTALIPAKSAYAVVLAVPESSKRQALVTLKVEAR